MARPSREGIDLLKLCFGLVLESIDFVLRFQGRHKGCWFPYIDKKTLCALNTRVKHLEFLWLKTVNPFLGSDISPDNFLCCPQIWACLLPPEKPLTCFFPCLCEFYPVNTVSKALVRGIILNVRVIQLVNTFS